MDKNPAAKNPFIVRSGMLVSLGDPRGHLITDKVYQNYRLEVEYRFAAKPGNCGVLVHASTPVLFTACSPSLLRCKCRADKRVTSGALLKISTYPTWKSTARALKKNGAEQKI